MSLIQKLKQSGTALTLAGSLLLGGSGCQPVATVVAGALVADAIRNNNNPEVVYVSAQPVVQPTPQPQTSNISRQNRFFAASTYKGDLNGNGAYEFEEYSDVGNEFEPNKVVFFGAEIFNRMGADLETNYYKIESDGKKLFNSEKLNIFGSGFSIKSVLTNAPEGTYLRTYKIGDETIGSTFIEVKSNLAKK